MTKIFLKKIFFDSYSLAKYSFEPLFKKGNDHRFLECLSRFSESKDSMKFAFQYIYYKHIFERNLSSISLAASDYVINRLDEFNHFLYPVLIHLIKSRNRINGLKEKLTDFFTLTDSNNDVEFESKFNEIVGIYFVEAQLNHKVVAVEIPSGPILPPNSKSNKSCDILATDGKEIIYYECKKSMSQDLRPRNKLGEFESFIPISHTEIRKWIRNELFNSNQKGANYLLIRVPFWSPIDVDSSDEKMKIWISRTFCKYKIISENHFSIVLEGLRLDSTKGFYVIFPDSFIKVDITNFEVADP